MFTLSTVFILMLGHGLYHRQSKQGGLTCLLCLQFSYLCWAMAFTIDRVSREVLPVYSVYCFHTYVGPLPLP